MNIEQYNRQVLQEIFTPQEMEDMHRQNMERLIEYELERGYDRQETEQTRSDFAGYGKL